MHHGPIHCGIAMQKTMAAATASLGRLAAMSYALIRLIGMP
jgi:hypothetical protein